MVVVAQSGGDGGQSVGQGGGLVGCEVVEDELLDVAGMGSGYVLESLAAGRREACVCGPAVAEAGSGFDVAPGHEVTHAVGEAARRRVGEVGEVAESHLLVGCFAERCEDAVMDHQHVVFSEGGFELRQTTAGKNIESSPCELLGVVQPSRVGHMWDRSA